METVTLAFPEIIVWEGHGK